MSQKTIVLTNTHEKVDVTQKSITIRFGSQNVEHDTVSRATH